MPQSSMQTTLTPAAKAIEAAAKFLAQIDNITTAEFARGDDRAEREALRAALAQVVAGQSA